MRFTQKIISILSLGIACSTNALTLQSQDITQAGFLSKTHVFNGFGCTGENKSPQLKWSDVPEGTKSFAISVYDPDAPTGSGWWHWQIVNIPSNVRELAANAGNIQANIAPTGSLQIKNDYGYHGFGGACPPQGHGVHHYRFTLHALAVEKLELPKDASGALAGYMINANTIETSTIEALYQRD